MTIPENHFYIFFGVIAVFLILVVSIYVTKPLVVCPKCGASTRSKPRKSWIMPAGKTVELTMGTFHCPKYGKSFRRAIKKRRIKIE